MAYGTVKKTALVREKNINDFFSFELSSFVQNKNKLELHKKVCENTDFCNGVMPSEDTEILGSNQYCKSDKT